mmetsp:Transcript_52720/g.138274  ORF Transcript_52720/g.138274 Transcript_52720/m.138274 type:complete len:248 (+) Transcript_52720:772-1515(+)
MRKESCGCEVRAVQGFLLPGLLQRHPRHGQAPRPHHLGRRAARLRRLRGSRGHLPVRPVRPLLLGRGLLVRPRLRCRAARSEEPPQARDQRIGVLGVRALQRLGVVRGLRRPLLHRVLHQVAQEGQAAAARAPHHRQHGPDLPRRLPRAARGGAGLDRQGEVDRRNRTLGAVPGRLLERVLVSPRRQDPRRAEPHRPADRRAGRRRAGPRLRAEALPRSLLRTCCAVVGGASASSERGLGCRSVVGH